MKGKAYFLLSILLICLFVPNVYSRVSDDEWKNLEQKFKEEYNNTKEPTKFYQRLQSIQKLAQADHPEVIKLLINEVIPYELQTQVRLPIKTILEEVVRILGSLTDDEAINQLIQSIPQSSDSTKVILIKGLGLIKNKPEIAGKLVEYLQYKNRTVQETAIKSLADCVRQNNLPADIQSKVVKLVTQDILPSELKEGVSISSAHIIEILNAITDETAVAELLKSLQNARGPAKVVLIRSVCKINTPAVIKELIKSVGSPLPVEQIAAIDSLAYSQPPEVLESIIKALNSNEWQVRASAVKYLGGIKDEAFKKEVVNALTKRQAKEDGRLKDDIDKAIKTLTSTRIDTSSVISDQSEGTIAVFYGIPIVSKNIIFVVDISGSMSVPAIFSTIPMTTSRSSPTGPTRIEVLKKELTEAIKKLPPNAKFNIITFSSSAVAWQDKLVSIKEYREKALEWISGLKTQDSTNIYDALEMALGYSNLKVQRPQSKKIPQRTVPQPQKPAPSPGDFVLESDTDTIYLMSDGEPCAGKYVTPDEICQAIQVLNQARKITINTIAVGQKSPFLERLAKENGGIYVVK